MGNWVQGKKAPANSTIPTIVPCPDEEWRPVVGWEGLYSVSSCGQVRSDRPRESGGIHKQSYKGQDGYVGVRLVRGSEAYTPVTHTLVAAAFIGPREPGMQIDHKDGNKLNNHASNLEYVTHAENHRRATAMGLHPQGIKHHAAKLTEDQVREIRAMNAFDGQIARKFGVSKSTVYSIRHRNTWRNVA